LPFLQYKLFIRKNRRKLSVRYNPASVTVREMTSHSRRGTNSRSSQM